MNRDDALRKIRIMFTITPDRGASEAEASAAVRQARSLMSRFEIEEAEIIAEDLNSDRAIIKQDVVASFHSTERGVLAVAVARLFDCHATYRSRAEEIDYTFYGYEVDVKVACWTMTYLLQVAERASGEYGRSLNLPDAPSEDLPRAMAAHHRGFVRRLAERIRQLLRARKGEQVTSSKALVIRKEEAIESKFGSFSYSDADYTDPDDVESHVQRGREEADNVPLDVRGIERREDADV